MFEKFLMKSKNLTGTNYRDRYIFDGGKDLFAGGIVFF